MAFREAIKKAIYLFNSFSFFNTELKLGYEIPILVILVNNNSVIKLAENPEFYKASKYIDLYYYFNREAV